MTDKWTDDTRLHAASASERVMFDLSPADEPRSGGARRRRRGFWVRRLQRITQMATFCARPLPRCSDFAFPARRRADEHLAAGC